jgi:outer membrane protein assembly factor BamB
VFAAMIKANWAILILITLLLVPSLIFTQQSNVQAKNSVDDWSMFHHDSTNTGFTNSTAPKSAPTVLWQTGPREPETGSVTFAPVVVDGVVYAAARFLHAYNATTGKTLWQGTDDVAASGQPVVINGVIYLQGMAFNASTGTKIWNTTVGLWGAQAGVVAAADGYVYTIGQGQEGLVGLNVATGALIWSSNYACDSFSPAVSNGYVYFNAGTDTGIIALNSHTGSKLWATQISPNNKFSSPAVDANHVYVRDGNGILCLDAMTGEKIWNYTLAGDVGNYFESSPAVAYGCVYIGSADGNIFALNANTGEKIWNYKTTARDGVESSPVIADGVVYVAVDDGFLYAFNAFSGDKLWSYKVGEPQHLYCTPAIANGYIYIGSEDTFMMALETSPTTTLIFYSTLAVVIIAVFVIGIFVIKRYRAKKS